MVSLSSPRARRAVKYLLLLLFLGFLLDFARRLYNFANLFRFFDPQPGIVLQQREVLDIYHARKEGEKGALSAATVVPVIPKILHQVFHNWSDPESTTVTLPDDWARARQSCLDLNPDWEYKLWTAKSSRDFIEEEFPWFLPTYDGYKFPIQRVDVIRYFALLKYGGVYIDLDNGCLDTLDALTYFRAFTTDGGHGTLSNNIIGGQAGHPLFQLLTANLMSWNWNWILPYIIVSYTSGQWFVTAMWHRYHRLLSPDGTLKGFEGNSWAPLHHILMDSRPGGEPFVLWSQERGGTWDNWDSPWFGWIGSHVGLVVSEIIGAILVLILIFAGCIWTCKWCITRRRRPRGYKKVETIELI